MVVWTTWTLCSCQIWLNKLPETRVCYLLEGPDLALRGLFIIGPNGVIKPLSVNDLPVVPNMGETLSLVKAFQFVESHWEVCLASWTLDSPIIQLHPIASKKYFEKVNQYTIPCMPVACHTRKELKAFQRILFIEGKNQITLLATNIILYVLFW